MYTIDAGNNTALAVVIEYRGNSRQRDFQSESTHLPSQTGAPEINFKMKF